MVTSMLATLTNWRFVLSLNFGDFLHNNPSQIGDFQILVINNQYNLDFGDFDFGNVLLSPKNRQNRGITVLFYNV